jgi:hypothetical protein
VDRVALCSRPVCMKLAANVHDHSSQEPSGALQVRSGGNLGHRYELDGVETIVGRASDCDIQLDDQLSSQRHARIVRHSNGYRIFDLRSSNGTFVNSQPVLEAEMLDGDFLQIGDTIFQFLARPQEGQALATTTLRRAAVPSALARGAQRMLQQARYSGPDAIDLVDHAADGTFAARPPAAAKEEEDEELSLREIWQQIIKVAVFFRPYWRSISAFAALGAIAGGLSYFVLPPPRRAVFEMSLVSSSADNPVQEYQRSNVAFFRSVEQTFVSTALIHRTLAALGEEAASEEHVSAVKNNLAILQLGGLNTYRGTYADGDGEQAVRFLGQHLQLYLDSEIEKTLKVIRAEAEFLRNQLAETEKELRRTEHELLVFKKDNIDGLPEQARQYYDYLFDLQKRNSESDTRMARIYAQLELDRTRLRGEEPLIESRIMATRPYEEALVEVNRSLAEAQAAGKGDEHPDVRRLKDQADRLRDLAKNAERGGDTRIERSRNPSFQSIKNSVHELEVSARVANREARQVEKDLKRIREVVDRLPELEARYAELTRSYDATKALHTRIFEQLKTTELQLELERASAHARYDIITPPSLEFVSKNKKVLARAFPMSFVGLFFGLGFAAFRRLRVPGEATPEEEEDDPVTGSADNSAAVEAEWLED